MQINGNSGSIPRLRFSIPIIKKYNNLDMTIMERSTNRLIMQEELKETRKKGERNLVI